MQQLLITDITNQLQAIHRGKIWATAANFEKKLGEISDEEAFVRPLPDLHSVAEIISHLIAWRRDTIVKIRTGQGSLTMEAEENWLPNDTLREKGWPALKAEYFNSLTELIALLQDRQDNFLEETYYDSDFKGNYPFSFVIHGMLHHDIYHLGQLGIVVKLLKKNR